jgi:urease alpha subunit
MVQIDADLTVYGEECTFGLGKVCVFCENE